MSWRVPMSSYDAEQERLQDEYAAEQEALLDTLARDLGYRLDIILIQHEILDGVSRHVVDERIKKLSRAYGVSKDEVRRRIGNIG